MPAKGSACRTSGHGASHRFPTGCARSPSATSPCSGGTSASACSSWSRVRTSRAWASSGGLLAIVVGAVLGCALLGFAGYIGADRRLPGDGAHAGAARAPGLVRTDGAQRRAEPRVGDLRAHRHRSCSERPRRPRLRLPRALGLGPRLRRDHACPALAGPIAFVRKYVRRFAVWAVAASVGYLTWWALDGAATGISGTPTRRAVSRSGKASISPSPGRVVASPRRRLHPLRARPRHAF